MKQDKSRIDSLLAEKSLAQSREEAKRMVMAGCVFVDGVRISKPSQAFFEDSLIEVKGFEKEFVSRGGYKLKKAIEAFDVRLDGLVCADIGASTGGFSDCMLQNGAKHVFAVDTGYGQLDWKVRSDARVTAVERFNARFLEADTLEEPIDFAAIDVSFISLKLIFPAVKKTMKPNGTLVSLIKPQFEAGREKVGKKGVVRDRAVHEEVIQNVIHYALDNGFSILGLDFSPIKGPNGNIEYLLYLGMNQESKKIEIENVVNTAWSHL
ncbi:MAG: TlyA family RNA methyltransferase [Eubacteriales bacterium]